MAKTGFDRSESFLQWIWQNLLFDQRALETTTGKKLLLLDPGYLNTSDGADFREASIEVDGLRWYGDVEIHTKASLWNAHGHHKDPRYNSVILHVVADQEAELVFTENNDAPFCLNLYPYLTGHLPRFLLQYNQKEKLPCAHSLHPYPESAFKKQIQAAHREYLEKKTDDILKYFDPKLPTLQAWKRALIFGIWDGMGIPHNREAMQQLCRELLEQWDGKDLILGKQLAMGLSGLSTSSSSLRWNHRSVRPAHHPKVRIPEAVALTHVILLEERTDALSSGEWIEGWNRWLRTCSLNHSDHLKILFGTVYLPSLYLLGNLREDPALRSAVRTRWDHLKSPIPPSLLTKYRSLPLRDQGYREKLGAIHQLGAYCEAGRCSECFVLKKAIQS